MTMLTGPERPAASGRAESLVILLHGYGADGHDLIGLADPFAPHLPNTMFVAPNAPERCLNNPAGFQWFPIPWLDGSDPTRAGVAAAEAFVTLGRWLDGVAEGGIGPERTALVGFSQGTMMALHVGPQRKHRLAGILGYSGLLADPEALKGEAVQKPPVMLIHGEADDLIPVAAIFSAAQGLAAAGIPVEWHISAGVPHGIGPDGLELGLAFLKRSLPG